MFSACDIHGRTSDDMLVQESDVRRSDVWVGIRNQDKYRAIDSRESMVAIDLTPGLDRLTRVSADVRQGRVCRIQLRNPGHILWCPCGGISDVRHIRAYRLPGRFPGQVEGVARASEGRMVPRDGG